MRVQLDRLHADSREGRDLGAYDDDVRAASSTATMVDISVVDLHDEPTADPRMERVVGTIVNHGDRPVARLSVRVDLLDDSGRLVDSVTTPPLSLTVAPLGGRATFEASVPRNPDVTTYHAVAVAR